MRLVQYNMCSVEELALLTQGLHLSGEYLEEEKSAIRREAGKDAPPEVLAAVRNKAEPVGGGGAAAFAKVPPSVLGFWAFFIGRNKSNNGKS